MLVRENPQDIGPRTNWVGDATSARPWALRQRFPQAHIAILAKPRS
jgi:hypothetical protein